jgi:hypothetical protein
VGIASVVIQDISFSASNYPLTNSFILDCGSPVYIYNNLNRFDSSTFQKNDRINSVLTGDSYSYVKDYSEVQINVRILAGEQLFHLKDVVYISGFHTNVISYRKLRQVEYY